MNINRISFDSKKDLFILEDESNPRSSKAEKIYPSTILDQVYDDQSPTHKNLREILEDLKQEILTGGIGNIVFPVTSVNGQDGDVILTKKEIGLGRVDNTADIDKPLSVPQRNAVEDMLNQFDFHVNFQDLYDHMKDTNNPHGVTLDQINTDNVLEEFVKNYIGLHNYSTDNTVHMDIRKSLSKLWNLVDDINNGLEDRIGSTLNAIDEHIVDEHAHYDLFDLKEDVSNKVSNFSATTSCDYTKYPSTKAVVEFLNTHLNEFKESLSTEQHIDDIQVINSISDLPVASQKYYHTAFFVNNTDNSYGAIALCKLLANNKYSWSTVELGIFTKYDPTYFKDGINGLSLNLTGVLNSLTGDKGLFDKSLKDILSNYYTMPQIDAFNFINKLNIVPGTMDGTIRYYVNDDMSTMSNDVNVTGLKKLAFLEWVTENELWDNSVRSNHILNNSIETRHIIDEAVTPDKIKCRWGYVIGNSDNPGTSTSHEVKLTELADILRPLIGGWPDPNTPGGNPWNSIIDDYIMHPHNWTPGIEYDLKDNSYARRYTGEISVLPNMDIRTVLSNDITTNDYKIIDAGGTWMYQSNPEEWTILGGSNITGHTFATVTLTSAGLFFETISIGDRMKAPYDIWVKYVKKSEINTTI